MLVPAGSTPAGSVARRLRSGCIVAVNPKVRR